MPANPLHAHNLSCLRGGRMLWRALSFDMQPGSALVIQGANGVGKTSLLRILAGFLRPHTGTVHYGKMAIRTPEDWAASPPILHWMNVPGGFTPALTLRRNLAFFDHLAPAPDPTDDLLRTLGLEPLLDRPFATLSSGEQQRARLVTLTITKRPFWILDEPLANLDTPAIQHFEAHLQGHLSRGGMALLTTHRPLSFKDNIKTLDLEAFRWG